MDKDNVKSKRTLCALCSLVIVASVALGAWAYYRNMAQRGGSESCLFDGWVYGREDQKRASEALVAAGLTDFTWRSGQLFAPNAKRALYHSALANAGAYPKAPSEFRSEALRDMSVFESDAKTRMREMNACILQLERTIEQMRGVEYATVGARARREQAGLSYKTLITATVGVSLQEDSDLNSDFLSAITLATKHQLGVDDVKNISIIDLKSGKSYWGIESSASTSAEVTLNAEKKRIEQYWRDKYLEAFEDVKNIRVSIAADVVWQSMDLEQVSSDSAIETSTSVNPNGELPSLYTSQSETSQGALRLAPTLGRFETLAPDDSKYRSASDASEVIDDHFSNVESNGYFNSRAYAERMAKGQDNHNSTSVGVARLGNPQRQRSQRIFDSDDSLCSEEAEERVTSNAGQASLSPPRPLLIKTSIHNDALFSTFPLDGVGGLESAPQRVVSAVNQGEVNDDNKTNYPVRQTGAEMPNDSVKLPESTACEKRFFVRSLNVRIAIPRSHIFQVALSKTPLSERNSLRPDSILDNSFYLATEEKYLAETKRFAVDLLRPTSKLYGWTEENLEEWVVVVAYSDATEQKYETPLGTGLPGSKHKAAYASSNSLSADLAGVDNVGALYVSELEGADLETHDPESVASNSDVRSTFVTDTDGNLTTVAPTVATLAEGSETTESNDEIVSLPKQKETWWEKLNVRSFLSKLRQPGMERNIVAAVVAGMVFLIFVLSATRRRARRVKTLQDNASASAFSRKDGRNNTARSGRPRTQGPEMVNPNARSRMSGFDEDESPAWEEEETDVYDDELEEELREITKRGDSNCPSTSRAIGDSRKDNVAPRNKDGRVDEEEAADYWSKREEALKLIARYPERAVASLQRWVTDSES